MRSADRIDTKEVKQMTFHFMMTPQLQIYLVDADNLWFEAMVRAGGWDIETHSKWERGGDEIPNDNNTSTQVDGL